MKRDNYFLNLKFNNLSWNDNIPCQDLIPAIQEHFYPQCMNRIKKMENFSIDEGLIFQLESLFWEIDQCIFMVNSMNYLNRSEELSNILEEAHSLKLKIQKELSSNKIIFQKLSSFNKKTKSKKMKKIAQNWILDFNISGFGLSKRKTQRLSEIEQSLSRVELNYQKELNNQMESATISHPIDKSNGLSPSFLKNVNIENGKYVFKYKHLSTLVELAEDPSLREKAWKLDINLGKTEKIIKLITEISALRQEKAKLFGFKSFTDLTLNSTLIENKHRAEAFFKPILAEKQKLFKKREKEMLSYAKQNGYKKIQPWDIKFFKNQMSSKNQLDEQYLKSFFPLKKSINGTILFLEEQWNIKIIENKQNENGTLYDVYYKNQYLGQIFIDLFFREEKMSGEWALNYTKGGFNTNPIVILSCSLNKNEENISISNLKTFYHELGHCLHFLLNRTYEPSTSGYDGIQEDFVEFPSQFMEYLVLDDLVLPYISLFTEQDKEFVQTVKNHYQNEEDDNLISQLYWLYLDFAYHNRKVTSEKMLKNLELQVYRKIYKQEPKTEDFHKINSFDHIFLDFYAASYFIYTWSRILSKKAYLKVQQSKNWDSLLAHGFMTKGKSELEEFKLI